jgi:hypothetical protein
LEGNLSNVICFFLFFWNFPEMLHYIVIKQVDTPVLSCDVGVPLLYKAWRSREDHVILVPVSNVDFPRIFCSSFKLFENQTVRSSRVHCMCMLK